MVLQISACHGKKMVLTGIMNPMLRLLSRVSIVQKLFGSLVYEKSMSEYDKGEYRFYMFEEAIRESEGQLISCTQNKLSKNNPSNPL
ncbi:MAG: hypothetical protein J6B06_00305 [Lachnospiraceae bacterium]|nr:hypothetical protein [Lachnospiraceae bacterium]